MSLLEIIGVSAMAFVGWFTWRAYASADPSTGPQSRRASIIEAWTNIAIGFSINFAANYVLIPMMTSGGHMTAHDNWWGGWVYTAISILRQYAIRRWFNAKAFSESLARKLEMKTVAAADSVASTVKE